ncbi:MAG: hypothetical protein GY794_23700, partial [bacterium]|nr:hypothetical protein [bacterium]
VGWKQLVDEVTRRYNIVHADKEAKSRIVAEDRLFTVQYSERRMHEIIDWIVNNKKCGTVEDWYGRLEFGGLGRAHGHFFLFTRDDQREHSDIPFSEPPQKGRKGVWDFLDAHLSAERYPFATDNPLHYLCQVQLHACRPTYCKGDCRAYCPRPIAAETGYMAGSKRWYKLKRDKYAQWMNEYGTFGVMKRVKANHDLSYVSRFKGSSNYMFGYGFKGERDEHIADIQRAFYDMDNAMPEHQRYFAWTSAALSRRTVSSDEALFRLTGADMIYRSRHPVYCNVMPPDSRPTTFIMRKSHQLATSGTALPNTQLVWLARYYARPSSGSVVLRGVTRPWETVCLRTCLIWFEFSDTVANSPSQPVFALRDGSGWYRQKRKEQILVLAYDPDIAKQPEQWADTRLMLYWPHRDESTLLLDPTTGEKMSAICRLEQVMDQPLFQLPEADRRLFSERAQLQVTLDALQETAPKAGPLDNAVELPGLDPAETTRPETLPTAERSVYNEVLPKLTIQQQRLVAMA